MEGIDLRRLVKARGKGYRYLVEAVIDHEMTPGDQVTDIIKKGAQGIAYDFWFWDGNYRKIAVAVEWEKWRGCNYFEIYQRANEVKKPITEIKFVCEFMPDEKIPEKNPLLERHQQS